MTAKNRVRPCFLILTLMLIHAGLLAWAATANSATYDEYAHLPAGVAYWKHWALPIYNLSPPLVRMLGSWPAVLDGAIAPPLTPALMSYRPSSRHFDYGYMFMAVNRDHFARYLLLGRFAMIPVALLGLWITSRWAGQLYGPGGAVIAAAVYAFSPGFIAHGALVTTDSGTTVAMLAAMWTWWRFCRALRTGDTIPWKLPALAVVTITIAHLCKFTAFLLWPAMLAVAVSDGLPVPLQIQLLPTEQVPLNYDIANGSNSVIQGIERDAIGRRVAYWAYPQHPGDWYGTLQTLSPVPNPVPAEDMCHLYNVTRDRPTARPAGNLGGDYNAEAVG